MAVVRKQITMMSRMTIGALCLMLLAQGCAMDGVKRVTVVDEHLTPVTGVVVIPLYSVSAGIGVGADGKGPHTDRQTVIESAFLFDSGEDLVKQQSHSRGVIIPIPPVVFIGKSRYVGSWLFLKKHHAPRAVQRSDVYAGKPIVLTTSTGTEYRAAVDLLTQSQPDQRALKRLFGVESASEDVTVILNGKAKRLLEAQE